jgi:hydroxypyruvate isomerase
MQLKFSANISMLFTEVPFMARFEQAAHHGFAAVECHFPYDHSIATLQEASARHHLTINAINTPAGDLAQKQFGFAAVPDHEDDFKRGFEQAFSYAQQLAIPTIHCLSGHCAPDEKARARQTFMNNMSWAAAQSKDSGISLLIEPLNAIDRPHYFVAHSDDVVALLKELDQPNVKLLFDLYHIQIMDGDVLRRLARHWPFIGHIQIASIPDRHEPDQGEINITAFFNALKAQNWQGWIGAEYNPKNNTQQGLGWMVLAT